MKTIFTFNTRSRIVQIGMLPPPRTGIGVFPKVVSIAREAALYPVLSMGVS